MKKLHLYFRIPPEKDRLIPGDRYIIPIIRRIIKGKKKISGLEKVFINLCKGLQLLHIDFDTNLPFKKIKEGEPVIILGAGKYAMKGYNKPNPVIAGIGLVTHPADWPNLCTEYPVVRYLQHADWTNNIYIPYYGAERCRLWPSGIDTDKWAPVEGGEKKYDLLVYTKIMWNKEQTMGQLKTPIINKIEAMGLSYREITYGQYKEPEYYDLLQCCRAMIFLCEHESQGFALCEALSVNVPVFAWDQGFWLDPDRFKWGEQNPVPASSVPFFDDSCGIKFTNLEQFDAKIDVFWSKITTNSFHPRKYILGNLTLTKSAERMLSIVREVYGN